MKIAYTVCSLNRLGQIKVLAQTLLKYNPDYHFFACLADEINDRVDIGEYTYMTFVPLSFVPIQGIEDILARYNIFELSCALKPYFGKFLMDKYDPQLLLYFDTDICVYNSFLDLEEALQDCSILLTPHYSSPLPNDGKYPLERDVLNVGLYNGGFFALKNDVESNHFLQWWKERLFDQGYNRVCDGMMVDQLWLNLAPLFFKNLKTFLNPGCNVAYWNLYERTLKKEKDVVLVNNVPLVFFHFSGFTIQHPERLSIHQNRFHAHNDQILMDIVSDYKHLLIKNNFITHLSIEPVYGKREQRKNSSFLKKKLIRLLALIGYKLEKTRRM